MRVLRTLGLVTAAFGGLSIAAPQLVARPLRLTDAQGGLQPGVAVACSAIGVRDVVSGLSLALLPPGRARAAAVGTRVAFDVTDALVVSRRLDPAARRGLQVAGLAWGGACLLAGLGSAVAARRH
ncbi:MAG TPA: hypothetical protein VF288_08970 [Mycobacteriales bacterium]